MPTYTIRDPFGRSVRVTRDTPPTSAEARQLLAQGGSAALPAASEEGGLLESLKTGGKSLLELVGRPGEFVAGFAGGAAQGGIGEGLKRGASAAFEGLGSGEFLSRLADSQQQESFSKVMEEQGLLKDSPTLRAAAGFAADVVTDPLNLLGGAGLLRRGLIKGASKAGALAGKGAEAEQLAKTLTGVGIGEKFQSTAVPALSAGARKVAAALPGVKKLQPYADLVGVKGTGTSLDAQQVVRGSDARVRASTDMVLERIDALRGQLTPAELDLAKRSVAKAIANADPIAVAEVANNPKLSSLTNEIKTWIDTIDQEELIQKGLRQTYLPVDLKQKLQTALDNLSTRDLRTLKSAVAANNTSTLPPALQKLGDGVIKQLKAKDGTLLYDPANLRWRVKNGTVEIEKFNTLLNYAPIQVPQQGQLPASIFRTVNPTLREGKERALSFAEGVAQGGETDIFKLMERRAINSARASESARLIDQMATQFGSQTAQSGFTKVSPTMQKEWEKVPALAALKDTYFPAPVAEELGRVTATLRDPETAEGVIRRGLKLFKGLATSLNLPAYPATNFLGNVLNMHLAGMDPVDITRDLTASTRAMAKFDDVIKQGGASTKLFNVRGLSDAEVLTLARERGVVGRATGFAGEFAEPDTLTPTAQLLTTGRYNPLNPENRVYNVIRGRQQQLIEDPAKLALFAHKLRTGATPDEAQMEVFKYLFNYADLSPFERQSVAGSIIPFYTWTRKNVPLILGSVVTRPQRLSQQQNLLQLVQEIGAMDPESAALSEDALPSYLKRGDQINLPSTGKTPIRGRLRMPMADIHTPFEIAASPLETLGGMVSPAVRMPLEYFQGETLRGQPIRYGMGAPTPLGELLGLAGETPGGRREQSNLSRYLTSQVPIPSIARPLLTEPREGSDFPLSENLFYRALGLSPTEVTPQVRQSARKERQRAKAEETAARRQRMREALLR